MSDAACLKCDVEQEAFGVACEEHTPEDRRPARQANIDQQVADNLARERAKQGSPIPYPPGYVDRDFDPAIDHIITVEEIEEAMR